MNIKSKLTIGWCVASIMLLGSETSAQQTDSLKNLPPAKWARVRTIDVKHLVLDLRFNWNKKQADGTCAITLSTLHPSDKIFLDAGALTINSVKLANERPLTFKYDGSDKNDGLEISLDRTYNPTEDMTIKINYRTNWSSPSDPNSLGGVNGKGLRFFGPTATEPTRRKIIWTMGEPEGNRYWFPCYDGLNDFRTTELIATVEKRFTVLSNGTLAKTTDNTDGTKSFHYKATVPYANFLTSLVVGEYVDIPQNHNGIPLHNYAFPNEVEATAASVVQLPEMVNYFSEVTGVAYPYPVYSQVFVQDMPWGVGANGFSVQTENMVDDDRTHADFFYLWDDLESETLAQQWFGNYITPSDWSHYWLSKSFARYFSELYDEYKNGSDELHLYPRNWNRNFSYLPNWKSGVRHPLVTHHFDNAETFINDGLIGFHGAEVLHTLRKHIGDDAWWRAIKLFIKANANKLVTTEDFRKAVEEASGEPMDWFFDQWVYKMGHPVFVVTKNYSEEKKQLTLTVKQTQKIDKKDLYPQTEFFEGKIAIEIDNTIETIWLEPKEENTFTFATTQQPKLVNFDYEDAWTKEITFEKSLDELLYQFKNDKDILGRRWAMNELVKVAKNEKATTETKEKIYLEFRNVMVSKAYWRFRVQVIGQLQSMMTPAVASNPMKLDPATLKTLMTIINTDKAWVKSAAITFLGMTRDTKHAGIYLSALSDKSDRVINSAAIALGKCKSPKAFNTLSKLVTKPSWKNQSLISALFGLKELRDPRGYDIAYKALADLHSPHWVLAVPIWDYRIIAAQTIASLGKSKEAYPLLADGLRRP
jgi:aminopeptidase N